MDEKVTKKRRKPNGDYKGNIFWQIPISASGGQVILSDLKVVTVPEPMNDIIKAIMAYQQEKKLKKFRPSNLSEILQNLSYPVIVAQNFFYNTNGEWIYLKEDELIDIEQLHFDVNEWFRNNLNDNDYNQIKKYIPDIKLVKKNIVIPLNWRQLDLNEKFYLFNLFPKYLASELSGNFFVETRFLNEEEGINHISHFDFYKLQSCDQRCGELIALPFKDGRKGQYWTYILDLYIRTIAGMELPYLALRLRTTRLKSEAAFSPGKNQNVIVYSKDNIENGYQVIKLAIRYNKKEGIWEWVRELTNGCKCQWLEKVEDIPQRLNTKELLQCTNIEGVGMVYANLAGTKHSVAGVASEYDAVPIYRKFAESVKSLRGNNIEFSDFLQLETIHKSFTDLRAHKEFRFEQLPDLLEIDAIYSTEHWLCYLKDTIFQLFRPKEYKSKIYNDSQIIFESDRLEFDQPNFQFSIYHLNKEGEYCKKIKINPIKITNKIEFNIEENLGSLNNFKEYLKKLICPSEKVKATLIELEYEDQAGHYIFKDKIDPKHIMRNLIASEGNSITQFISFQYNDYVPWSEESEKTYKDEIIKYMGGFKDLFRNLGFIGKSIIISNDHGQAPIYAGLWFISKYKTTYDYYEKTGNDAVPSKIVVPVIVTIIDDEAYMAIFTKNVYERRKNNGPNFKVKWMSYAEGLIELARSPQIFNELNPNHIVEIRSLFIKNALEELRRNYPEREIILYTHSQNARSHLKGLQNPYMGESGDNIRNTGSEVDELPRIENMIVIKVTTGDRNETPDWINIDSNGKEIWRSLRQGVFKLTDRVYYLINPKADSHESSRDLKEYDYAHKVSRMNATEIGVYDTDIEKISKYIEITRILKSRSVIIHYPTGPVLPLPLFLAEKSDEYLNSYLDEYFLNQYLKNKEIKEAVKRTKK